MLLTALESIGVDTLDRPNDYSFLSKELLVSSNPIICALRIHLGGADRTRTDDIRLAKAALSQLSYSPFGSRRALPPKQKPARSPLVGLGRFELPTSRLSGVRSNQLSYRPEGGRVPGRYGTSAPRKPVPVLWKLNRGKNQRLTWIAVSLQLPSRGIPTAKTPTQRPFELEARVSVPFRKEVIQPQVLLQLPCYDFTPITDHTLSACLPCGLARRFLVQPAFVM